MHPRKTNHTASFALVCLLGATGACSWTALEAIVQGYDDAGGSVIDDAGVAVDTDAPAPSDAPAGEEEEEAAGDGPRADAGPDNGPCTSSQMVVRQWTFDSNVEGWSVVKDKNLAAALTWTGATGNPTPGALQVEAPAPKAADGGAANADGGAANAGMLLQYAASLGNLTGRMLAAWIWVDSGPSLEIKMFLQTGSTYAWGDNGPMTLAPQTWTCVAFEVSTPAFNNPSYDPASVVALGIELHTSAAFRVYVDSVRYY